MQSQIILVLKEIEQYEMQHKKSFLVGGVPFKEYWAGQV